MMKKQGMLLEGNGLWVKKNSCWLGYLVVQQIMVVANNGNKSLL